MNNRADILSFCASLSAKEVDRLPFQKPLFAGIENKWLANQAQCYQLARAKLPAWAATSSIWFPDRIAVEQATSQWVAQWKSTLLQAGCPLYVDTTAGLGVDAAYLGAQASEKLLFETDPQRAEILRYNLEQLGMKNHSVHNQAFTDWFRQYPNAIDRSTWVYADPDRRPAGERQMNWEHTTPNILDLYTRLRHTGCFFLVKLSPMDEPAEALLQMPGARAVYVVSLHNEVKEILLLWNFSEPCNAPAWYAVDILRSGEVHTVEVPSGVASPAFGRVTVGGFVLDPWAALRKGFKAAPYMASQGYACLSGEAQLFTSASEPGFFPGRIFRIDGQIASLADFGKRNRRGAFHVIARSLPQTADAIRQKYGWIAGGDRYVICYPSMEGQTTCLLCTRMGNELAGA